MENVQQAIHKRQSTRVPYDSTRTVPPEQIREILEAARWSPTAHNMQNFEIVVVDDHKFLDTLSAIHAETSEIFIRENFEQLSFSEEELKRRKTGILGTMFPSAWRNPDRQMVEEADDTHEEEPPSQTRLAAASSALIVVLYDPSRRAPASEGDFLGIVSLGCVMQNMWLTAESLGIAFQILSSFTSPSVESKMKIILDIPANLKVAFTARLGYTSATAPYLRVRRDVEDFAYRNRYGATYSAG